MKLVFDYQIYKEFLLEQIPNAKKSIDIATADIKDVYVQKGKKYIPLLEVLAERLQAGVEIRILHAKEPGVNFRKDFDRYPVFLESGNFIRALCPRVHTKMIIIDRRIAYMGSANLTGSGMGAKSINKRNFETGTILEDKKALAQLQHYFDSILTGKFCLKCGRKEFCPDPLNLY